MADEPVVLTPGDPEAESANTWWLGAEPHERLGVSVSEVVAAFEELAGLIGTRVRESGHRGTATFFVWHDAQAGQLRCSTSSAPPERLPLDPGVRRTDRLEAIVAEFLADGERGFVASLGPFGPVAPPVLEVWTCDVSVVAVEEEH